MKIVKSQLLAAAAVLGATLAPLAAHAQTTVLPGYWESNNSVSLLLSSKSTTRKCLTAEQVQQWVTNPETKHYTCVYDHKHIADGHATFHGICTDKKGRHAAVSIEGTYAPEHFVLNAHMQFHMTAGVDLPVMATTDAHRISATCPADLPPGE
ncbi:MAG: DUF3617 domain-containing protein [Caulobacteraceae bacterium]